MVNKNFQFFFDNPPPRENPRSAPAASPTISEWLLFLKVINMSIRASKPGQTLLFSE